MRIETTGRVKMRGEPGRGTPVSVTLDGDRLIIDLIGDWDQSELGITSLNEGFAIRAEGEEIVLVTDDDAALAEGLGMSALNPRLARRIAASHPPEERPLEIEVVEPEAPSFRYLPAIGLAVSGALMILGGFMLESLDPTGLSPGAIDAAAGYWFSFTVGGVLMIALAFGLSIGWSWAKWVSVGVMAVMIAFLVNAGQEASFEGGQLVAYGLVAAGIVVGVSIAFGAGSNTET